MDRVGFEPTTSQLNTSALSMMPIKGERLISPFTLLLFFFCKIVASAVREVLKGRAHMCKNKTRIMRKVSVHKHPSSKWLLKFSATLI
jgi:hypothetical protein